MGPTEPYEALASDAFDELDATRGHGVFISTFCKPDSFGTVFTNILGGFTPCFCDVVLLGALPLDSSSLPPLVKVGHHTLRTARVTQ